MTSVNEILIAHDGLLPSFCRDRTDLRIDPDRENRSLLRHLGLISRAAREEQKSRLVRTASKSPQQFGRQASLILDQRIPFDRLRRPSQVAQLYLGDFERLGRLTTLSDAAPLPQILSDLDEGDRPLLEVIVWLAAPPASSSGEEGREGLLQRVQRWTDSSSLDITPLSTQWTAQLGPVLGVLIRAHIGALDRQQRQAQIDQMADFVGIEYRWVSEFVSASERLLASAPRRGQQDRLK